jgi:hypothetical protein
MAKRSWEAKRSGRDTSFPYEPTIPTIPTDEHYTAIETFSVVGARKLIDEQVELIESNKKLINEQVELIESNKKLINEQVELIESNKKLIESSYCFNPNI